MSGNVPVLVPAYKPGEALVGLVSTLLDAGCASIVVVNDGSGPEFDGYFDRVAADARVHVVAHAVNLGKGAALKTGMNYALVHFPGCAGVVTADADGQHAPEDILRVAERLAANPRALILGARAFAGDVPLRSRFGNTCTRYLMYLTAGQKLTDTQTGLRGVPAQLIPHLLKMPSSGYEFELDMLMACKAGSCPVVEVPIRTIYLDRNASSHFHPIFDSMRIYFLLLRFSAVSFLTAVLDNLVFALAFVTSGSIGRSQIAARLVAMTFNYLGARRMVFHSRQRHAIVLPKYVALVAANGLLSYMLLQFIHSRFGVDAIAAKICAEALLFLANFAIQRDFIFTRRDSQATATDWDRYYTSVPPTARLTRRYTTRSLLAALRHARPAVVGERLAIVEIGGANSCFLDRIAAATNCRSYDVVDTNRYGLSLLEGRLRSGVVRLHEKSVLDLSMEAPADAVFSVGLVEHFRPADTRTAVLAHFDAVRPGGVVILTFPTPTLLYRVARSLIEAAGMWKFPDERPLKPGEVLATVRECGDVLYHRTLWPLILTQEIVVARKHPLARRVSPPAGRATADIPSATTAASSSS